MTGGKIKLKDARSDILDSCCRSCASGAKITCTEDTIELDMGGVRPHSVSLRTAPYPAFPRTCRRSYALNAVADGCRDHRNHLENRFMHVQEMQRMARYHGGIHTAIIRANLC